MKQAIGIDIGGTKVAIALISEKGEMNHRYEMKSNITSAEALFQSIVKGVHFVLGNANLTVQDIEGIGVGVPGKVDVENGVAVYQNNIPWHDFPVVERFKEALGVERVRIDNDVKVAAYAEYRLANLSPKDMFGYITISTGIACTNIINDQIIRGSGFSGEIGFLPVPSSVGLRPLEEVAAGPGIQAYARSLYQDDTLTTKDVFERYLEGEPKAIEAVNQSAMGVAVGIFSMICLVDPKAIVLGGSVALKNPFYVERIKSILNDLTHSEQKHVLERLTVSQLGSDNGIVGAGMLVL
ncbi:ROK family protein [Aerococcaceae bacterium NML201209]|nr:ROK family protein [Aerococcaceae bacterium NML201209]MCW6662476.1 ROK family protein [Aerococcaceae bacterium NML190073]MCW6664474.1 ROK family protein [Aerococcaceae bacterium NML191219]MCW6665956.1 ROK family protein [Aerococcaceae bacterium NML190938]MCW6680098.1 ROK family protein [Aerococcaceae bacterium NML130460]